MKASSFGYLAKSGVKNLWSNRMMTLASVGTLIACLLIVGFAALFSINIESIVSYLGEQNELVVFIDVEAPEGTAEVISAELNSMEGLADITFISRQEALETVVEKYLDGDAGLLDGVENDFLPESFRARVTSPEDLDALIASIRRIPYVSDVEAPTELTKTLVSVRKTVNTVGGAIIVALVAVSLVIIVNTIRASVFTRRREINIMKYVGATNSFIRVPFIVEGVVLGIVAALIAYLLIWLGYDAFTGAIVSDSGTIISSALVCIVPFREISTQILAYFLLSGIVVGAFGSGCSMRGYLKV